MFFPASKANIYLKVLYNYSTVRPIYPDVNYNSSRPLNRLVIPSDIRPTYHRAVFWLWIIHELRWKLFQGREMNPNCIRAVIIYTDENNRVEKGWLCVLVVGDGYIYIYIWISVTNNISQFPPEMEKKYLVFVLSLSLSGISVSWDTIIYTQ